MINSKSIYALNKKDPDAIVYPTADGKLVRVTREYFPSEEAFLAFKSWSDEDFHEEEKKYLIGKQYESEKASHGGDRKSAEAKSRCQIGNLIDSQKTCERIAEENGISSRSVCRAEAFSKAVDIAEEIEPGIRSEFLDGSIRATEKEIHALARADPEDRPELLAELRKPPGERAKPSKTEKPKSTPISQLQQISEDMLSAKSRGTPADMLYELEDALDSLMFRWTMCIGNYRDYFAEETCRSEINQLAQTGLDYLQQIKEGELPI